MSIILITRKRGLIGRKRLAKSQGTVLTGRHGFNIKKSSRGSAKISLTTGASMIGLVIFLLGAFYLYQVNNIATKGYEIKKIENKLQDLNKESEKLKIKEVELKSMYNIEKSTEELDLVSSRNISYIQMAGPIAMK